MDGNRNIRATVSMTRRMKLGRARCDCVKCEQSHCFCARPKVKMPNENGDDDDGKNKTTAEMMSTGKHIFMERCAREVRQRATETVLGTEYIQKNEFIDMPDGTVFSSVFFLLAFLLLQSFATFYLLLLLLLAAVDAAFRPWHLALDWAAHI